MKLVKEALFPTLHQEDYFSSSSSPPILDNLGAVRLVLFKCAPSLIHLYVILIIELKRRKILIKTMAAVQQCQGDARKGKKERNITFANKIRTRSRIQIYNFNVYNR